MPVTADTTAPYAPASAVLEIVQRHRQRGLPPTVDASVLQRSGVADSLIPRTLHALATLDLIDDQGKPTSVLEGLRLAPEAEYQQRLVEWLNAAYADALQFLDPASATEDEIRDAFRQYKPIGQQSRMVTLFTGLYGAAGVGADRLKTSTARPPRLPSRKPAAATSTTARQRMPRASDAPTKTSIPVGIPAPIGGLLTKLPVDGSGWSQQDRDKFMVAFGAILDFCFPVVQNGEQGQHGTKEEIER